MDDKRFDADGTIATLRKNLYYAEEFWLKLVLANPNSQKTRLYVSLSITTKKLNIC